MPDFEFKAFITYSHTDRDIAAWLQRSLESYRVPRHLIGTESPAYRSRKLGRFFRDRDDLSAGSNLTQSITRALHDSEFLIVVCSPESAQSRWVNLEIDEFRRTHGADQILCLIAKGEPFAADGKECFPPALGYRIDPEERESAAEPAAADARDGGDGRRLAMLKIVAGLVGVRLDDLVRRDAHRRNRRMLAITAASVIGMIVMSALTVVAIDARNNEQLRRAEAEDLIEFMLGDLRDRLDAVGRLDALDSVAEKAIEYYSRVDLSEHSAASLGRRARAFHLLGEVGDLRGDMETARSSFEEAYESTRELIRRSPDDGDLVFDHAQSVFWLGYLDWRLGKTTEAESAFFEYLSLANRLRELDAGNAIWLGEAGHANLNLGVYALQTGSPAIAIPYFDAALSVYQDTAALLPNDSQWQWQIAQAHAWLADAHLSNRSLRNAIEQRTEESAIYQKLLAGDSANQELRQSLLISLDAQADLHMQMGDIDTALQELGTAKGLADDLYSVDPDNTFNRQTAAWAHAYLGEALSYRTDGDEPIELFDTALEIAANLVARDDAVVEWQQLFHSIRVRRARLLIRNGQADAVLPDLMETSEELSALATDNPEVNEIRQLEADANLAMAAVYEGHGASLQAGNLAERALEALAGLEEDLPPIAMALSSQAYRLIGNRERADALDAQLRDIGFAHPVYLPASNR